MPDPHQPGPAPEASRGVSAEALRLLGSLTRHLQALAALIGAEGRDAAGQYLRGAIALGIALTFLAFGYVFTLLFVAFALERFLHVDWLWIALAYAALHLLGALIGLQTARTRFSTPVFRATAEEIRRDVAALHSTTPNNPAS